MVRICSAGDQLPKCVRLAKVVARDCSQLTLEDVQTDAAQSVDVGVVDLGEEADLGRGHGVVIGEKELELEDAAWSCQPARQPRSDEQAYLRTVTVRGRRWSRQSTADCRRGESRRCPEP